MGIETGDRGVPFAERPRGQFPKQAQVQSIVDNPDLVSLDAACNHLLAGGTAEGDEGVGAPEETNEKPPALAGSHTPDVVERTRRRHHDEDGNAAGEAGKHPTQGTPGRLVGVDDIEAPTRAPQSPGGLEKGGDAEQGAEGNAVQTAADDEIRGGKFDGGCVRTSRRPDFNTVSSRHKGGNEPFGHSFRPADGGGIVPC